MADDALLIDTDPPLMNSPVELAIYARLVYGGPKDAPPTPIYMSVLTLFENPQDANPKAFVFLMIVVSFAIDDEIVC